ncbi:sugar nucleotide-binding protein [Streptococcus sp. 20-1249]|uniref:sugar nucleotide-binding protein n=1 Tax=Streptococcus hepaticus TaxID=3349163 RepID=UPI003748E890
MKKVLITGKNSFLGRTIISQLQRSGDFEVQELDVKDDNWKKCDFSSFDVVINVAGIAHVNAKTIDSSLYYKVNHELSNDIAIKAVESGVGQLIYLSSMSVYGERTGRITVETQPNPTNHYGKSKLLAENFLNRNIKNKLNLVILRPPMIYGKNCPGNYTKLVDFMKKVSVFPKVSNQRSMLYSGNLAIFIENIINREASGLFYPQNKEYVNTYNMVKTVLSINGKQVISLPNFFCTFSAIRNVGIFKKIIGDFYYDCPNPYSENFLDFNESIRETEKEITEV